MNPPEPPSPRSGSPASLAAMAGPPPKVPDYELIRCIGAGSYGEVWLARSAVGGWVALKVVRRSKFEHDAHYEREFIGVSAYAPLSVKEPELLRVLHVGRNDVNGFFYYAMELADAATDAEVSSSEFGVPSSESAIQLETRNSELETYLPRTLKHEHTTRGRLPLAECLKLGRELATALGRLHRAGLLHRDVKPSNVVYVRGEARLADIGLVTNYDHTLSLQSGTMGYSPPEGVCAPDGDLYALGKLLYVVSTGQDRMQFPKLPDLGGLGRKVAREIRELNPVLLKACENEPKRRYQTAEKFIADLEYLEEGSSLRRLRMMKKAMKVAAVVMGLALVGGAVWFWQQRAITKTIRNQADETRRVGLLSYVQSARSGLRKVGWADHHWRTLGTASVIRVDKHLLDQAAATLAGLDARPGFMRLTNGGSAVWFAPDGRLLVGGIGSEPACVIGTNHDVTPASARGSGPVCLDSNGTPLHVVMESPRRLVSRELMTGTERQSFSTESDLLLMSGEPVVAISSDGTRLAAALKDGGAVRWEIGATPHARTLGGQGEYMTALAFSPAGALLAAGRSDGRVTVHDAQSLDLVSSAASSTRKASVTSLAFGRDYLVPDAGADPARAWLLAIGNSGAQILVWDMARGDLRATLRGSQYEISALAFSPDGATLASGGRYAVRLWDVTTEKMLLSLPSNLLGGSQSFATVDRARGLAFSPDGTKLAVAARGYNKVGGLGIWELAWHRGLRALRGLATQVDYAWISPDSRWVAGVSHDWQLGVWDLASGRLHAVFEAPSGWSPDNAGCVFDAAGKTVAFTAGSDGRLYDLETRRVVQRWKFPRGLSDTLAYDAQGRLVLLRSEDSERRRRWVLLELKTDGEVSELLGQTETNWQAYAMRMTSDGKLGAVVGVNRQGPSGNPNYFLTVLDLQTGREKWPRRPNYGENVPILDAAGQWMGHALAGNEYRWTSLTDGKEQGTIPGLRAFTTSRNQVVRGEPAGGRGGTILFNGRDANDEGAALGTDWRTAEPPVFSRDECFLAWGTTEGVVLVADLAEVTRRLAALRQPAK